MNFSHTSKHAYAKSTLLLTFKTMFTIQPNQSDNVIDRPGRPKKDFSILYVDDEQPNLRGFKSSFRRHYNIFTALNADEALEILKEHEIHLIISDHRMPGLTGTELLKRVHAMNPAIIRMILSGFIKLDELKEATSSFGIHDFVGKPWDFDELKSVFDNLLGTNNAPVKTFQ